MSDLTRLPLSLSVPVKQNCVVGGGVDLRRKCEQRLRLFFVIERE